MFLIFKVLQSWLLLCLSPLVVQSPPAGYLCMACVLQLLGLSLLKYSFGLEYLLTSPSRILLVLQAYFVFFSSRGGKWPNAPSFVLRHFTFVSVQHRLVVTSLHLCLPAQLHVCVRQRPTPSSLCRAWSPWGLCEIPPLQTVFTDLSWYSSSHPLPLYLCVPVT